MKKNFLNILHSSSDADNLGHNSNVSLLFTNIINRLFSASSDTRIQNKLIKIYFSFFFLCLTLTRVSLVGHHHNRCLLLGCGQQNKCSSLPKTTQSIGLWIFEATSMSLVIGFFKFHEVFGLVRKALDAKRKNALYMHVCKNQLYKNSQINDLKYHKNIYSYLKCPRVSICFNTCYKATFCLDNELEKHRNSNL